MLSGRVAGGGQGTMARTRVQRAVIRLRVSRKTLAKHVRDGGKAVGRLLGGNVVDMRRVGEVRGLVGDVSGQRVVVSAGERLAEGSRLYDALVGKLLVRGCHNTQTRGGLVPSRHAWGLGGKLVLVLAQVGAVSLGRLLVKSSLDNLALLLAHVHATLQLLLHDGVLGDETGRQTSQTNLLDTEAIPLAGESRCLGAGSCASALGKIQLSWSMAGSLDYWGTGFLLDKDLGRG
jgi:hypothetical protein